MGQILGLLGPAIKNRRIIESVTKDMCPPSSPDINPIDYFVWSHLEARVNRRPHTIKASLNVSIREQFAVMPRDLVTETCGWFGGCITARIEAEDDYIE